MVQQNYVHRLALGRSAYEAPLTQTQPAEPEQHDSPAQTETGSSDTLYVQRYDERGHPINPDSRSAARRLRRAQNDVLSTIGITLPTSSSSGAVKSAEAEAAAKAQQALEDFESWTFLGLSFAFEAAVSVTTAAAQSQRIRIQTFRRYAGFPVSVVARSEARRLGVVPYFLAGKPEYWSWYVLDVVLKIVALQVPTSLNDLWVRFFGEKRVSHQTRKKWVTRLEGLLLTGKTVVLDPLYAISILQRLHLVPFTPLLVWPWQYSIKQAYLSLLPALPTVWTVATTARFLTALPWSPLGISLLMDCLVGLLHDALTRYTRALLPRPDNPEKSAITGEDSSQDQWPMNGYPRLQPTLQEELALDLRWIGKTSTYYWYRLKNLFAPSNVRRHRQRMLATFLDPNPQVYVMEEEAIQLFREVHEFGENMAGETAEQAEERMQRIEQSIAALNNSCPNTEDYAHIRLPLDRANALVQSIRRDMQQDNAHDETNDADVNDMHSAPARHNSLSGEPTISLTITETHHPSHAYSRSFDTVSTSSDPDPPSSPTGPLASHPASSSSGPSSPSLTTSSSPLSSPGLEPTNVQVRTRSGSTSTLHMDVEINQSAVDGSTYTTSFSASPRTAAVETSVSQVIADGDLDGTIGSGGRARDAPYHRVSDLSLLPADFLAQALLDVGVQVLLLPLQSYQARLLAGSFLRAAHGPHSAPLADVYPPGNWFGLGLRAGGPRGAAAYVGKLAVCLGVEALLSLGSWMVLARAVKAIGRRWLDWGHL